MTLILASGTTAVEGGGVLSSDQFAILRDLNLISNGNLNQGSSEVNDDATLGAGFGDLLFNQTASSTGANLITSLINSNTAVIIFGVDLASNTSLGGPTGLGETRKIEGGEQPPLTPGMISVKYDASACSGNGASVFDVHGHKIPDPPFIILAHELAHAQDFINGSINNSSSESVAEPPAIAVENLIRAETNALYQQATSTSISLSQRDPNNHGGGCNPPGGPPQNPWKLNCFIATAAYGSVYAEKVNELRRFRDHYLLQTRIGNDFFDRLYAEYYRYSPTIASTMTESPTLRNSIRRVVVDPFVEFLGIFELYLNCDSSQEFAAGLRETLGQEPVSHDPHEADAVCAALISLKSRFQRVAQKTRRVWPKLTATEDAALLISQLGDAIVDFAAGTEYSLWVLVEPLLIQWSAAQVRAHGAGIPSVVAAYLRSLDSWFDRMPLSSVFVGLSPSDAERELSKLRSIMFTGAAARHKLGVRLLRELVNRIDYDLRPALRRTGYV